jgi:hypothetical protein
LRLIYAFPQCITSSSHVTPSTCTPRRSIVLFWTKGGNLDLRHAIVCLFRLVGAQRGDEAGMWRQVWSAQDTVSSANDKPPPSHAQGHGVLACSLLGGGGCFWGAAGALARHHAFLYFCCAEHSCAGAGRCEWCEWPADRSNDGAVCRTELCANLLPHVVSNDWAPAVLRG